MAKELNMSVYQIIDLPAMEVLGWNQTVILHYKIQNAEAKRK